MLFQVSLPWYLPSPRLLAFCLVLLGSLIFCGQLAINGLMLAAGCDNRGKRTSWLSASSMLPQTCFQGGFGVFKSSKSKLNAQGLSKTLLVLHLLLSHLAKESQHGQDQCQGNSKAMDSKGVTLLNLLGFTFSLLFIHSFIPQTLGRPTISKALG